MSDIYYNLLHIGKEKSVFPHKCVFFRIFVEKAAFVLYDACIWGYR